MPRREPLDDIDDFDGDELDESGTDLFLFDLDEYDDTSLINESGVTAEGYESLGAAWEREEFAS